MTAPTRRRAAAGRSSSRLLPARLLPARLAAGLMLAGMVAVAPPPVAAQSAGADPALTLKRVLLSTGGVGYFEYEAEVEGDVALPLDVRLDQVNDVLKSIVVYDDTGAIGQISLPGRQPLRQLFRELPFGPEHLTSPVTLLNALRGAEVAVTGAAGAHGRLLSVTAERQQVGDRGDPVSRHRLALHTEAGLQQVILEDVAALQFRDPKLQAQVAGALAAVAANAAQDRRRLIVSLSGTGRRTVRVAYVAETPLWKTTYRLTLPRDSKEDSPAWLQGWAVVENMTGEAWHDVDLTLVSGNPVTLRQALYESYYVDRPDVPVEVMGRVLPGVDTGYQRVSPSARTRHRRRSNAVRQGSAHAPPEQDQVTVMQTLPDADTSSYMDGKYVRGERTTERVELLPSPTVALATVKAAASTEATTQVIFRMPAPVSVASGHSLMVPITNRRVPAERIALYQPRTHATHPLAAVRLTNDGASGLPPGVLTLYEQGASEQGAGGTSFVGDARLAALPAGEERIISFALDQKTRIDRASRSAREVVAGRIVRGVLEITRKARQETIYTIKAPAREARTLVVEQSRPGDGWTLVEPAEARLTDTAWRLRWAIDAGAARTVRVVLQRPVSEQVRLLRTDPRRIGVYLSMQQLPRTVRDALARVVELSRTAEEAEVRQQALAKQATAVAAAQDRVRQNLQAVPRDGDLYRRYLKKLGEQEDSLERIAADRAAARGAADTARKALADYVEGLTL